MFFALGVGDRFKKVGIARDPAHVLGWAGPCPFQAERVSLPRLGLETTLEKNLVPPAVPEVVLVLEAEPLAAPRGGCSLNIVVVESSNPSPSKSSSIRSGSP